MASESHLPSKVMSSPVYRTPNRRTRASFSVPSTPKLPADRDILDGLLPSPIQTVTKPSASADDDEVKVNDLKYIGSYNWVEAQKPTIIVPGKL